MRALRASAPETAWAVRVTAFGPVPGSVFDAVVSELRDRGVDAVRRPTTDPTPSDARGPAVVVLDASSPELLRFIREQSAGGTECLIALDVSRTGLSAGELWSVLEAGANDVFAWERSRGAAAVVARMERWRQVDAGVASPVVRDTLVGTSREWSRVLRRVVEIARFTDSPLLISGESGTGKELVARLIHALDSRPRKGELVVLDCTTIVPSLSGSEFFGHERGAFTGADSARDGAFALADGGTLFLDEVGELPLTLQAELLRVVQEGTFKRVGSNVWRTTSFRLVCATNRNLLDESAANRFRRDFYYRIAAWRVDLPSLRDRREDIIPLASHFLRQLRPGSDSCTLDRGVREFLLRRGYPGNVRDLRHLVTRMSQRHVGPGPITLGDVPEEERLGPDDPHRGHGRPGLGDPDGAGTPSGPGHPAIDWRGDGFERSIRAALMAGTGLRDITSAAAEIAIRLAIAEEDGSLPRASARLGVTARALQQRRAAQRSNGHRTQAP